MSFLHLFIKIPNSSLSAKPKYQKRLTFGKCFPTYDKTSLLLFLWSALNTDRALHKTLLHIFTQIKKTHITIDSPLDPHQATTKMCVYFHRKTWSAQLVWPDKLHSVMWTDFLTAFGWANVSFCVWADVCVSDVAVMPVKLLLNYITQWQRSSDSTAKTTGLWRMSAVIHVYTN